MSKIVDVVKKLIKNNITIATAESATAGGIASSIGDVEGASNILSESYITYSNDAKNKILGVSFDIIEKYGVVSENVAKEMVISLKNITKADICISITGSFGPTTYENVDIGDVYIGIMYKNKINIYFEKFDGNRLTIKQKTIEKVFEKISGLV